VTSGNGSDGGIVGSRPIPAAGWLAACWADTVTWQACRYLTGLCVFNNNSGKRFVSHFSLTQATCSVGSWFVSMHFLFCACLFNVSSVGMTFTRWCPETTDIENIDVCPTVTMYIYTANVMASRNNCMEEQHRTAKTEYIIRNWTVTYTVPIRPTVRWTAEVTEWARKETITVCHEVVGERRMRVKMRTRKPSYRWQTRATRKPAKNCSNSSIRRTYNVVADNTGLSSCV